MTPSRPVLQTPTAQLQALLTQERTSRIRSLVLCRPGMIEAEMVRPQGVAASLPQTATVPGSERRLQRFLANERTPVATMWQLFVPHLLAVRDSVFCDAAYVAISA